MEADNWEDSTDARFEEGFRPKIVFGEIGGNLDYLDFVSDLHLSFTVPARRL